MHLSLLPILFRPNTCHFKFESLILYDFLLNCYKFHSIKQSSSTFDVFFNFFFKIIYIYIGNYIWIQSKRTTSCATCAANPFWIAKLIRVKITFLVLEDTTLLFICKRFVFYMLFYIQYWWLFFFLFLLLSIFLFLLIFYPTINESNVSFGISHIVRLFFVFCIADITEMLWYWLKKKFVLWNLGRIYLFREEK
jgi:hypothetical protein